ncbi:amidohydrolase [Congregibacter litoralis]|uniref:Putative metal-dependent hydrolase with the TIM-barrel fold protein n=1 Tax=Congregibacter litoralis KT71 TaxID=314285 RepID=A4A6N8_9GAMM|nr:amidohydrolase family protein [Congregibacter litoralis]EAQ98685.2 putative metal-dependent hydrolase with the TIM-barrel fold protein [Congregibacter litoralis KT71]
MPALIAKRQLLPFLSGSDSGFFIAVCLGLVVSLGTASPLEAQVIFTADRIITMDPGLPEATAVAVKDGRIVAVGSLKQLQNTAALADYSVDRQLEDMILTPGFIDPHVHPTLPAVLTQFPFLAPDDWQLPTGSYPGALTPDSFEAKLRSLVNAHEGNHPFIAWGYHPLWHGDVYREQLSDWFPDQSVMLWHRSFHELILNDAAIKELKLSEEEVRELHEADWEQGHFWENGLKALIPKLGFVFEPTRFLGGMENFLAMAHRGGVTTALDMGTGIFGNPEQELALIRKAVKDTDAPLRIIMTPIITDFLARGRSPEEAEKDIDRWRESNSHRVMIDRHFKLMMDGAIYSGLAQMGPPGYLDGHEGQWMAPLEVTTSWAQHFWQAGYKLHAHTNGDASAAALIEMLKALQLAHPRPDHRLTLEHFAYTTEEQIRELGALGGVISANPYYHYILSDLYGEAWLGPDRSAQMVPLGSVERAGIPLALHSDAPMAPLEPLTLAWTATNRVTINGNATGQNQRISLDTALRGITIDAAWIMGWEDEIGSIRAGKRADFTVLEEDPYTVGVEGLRDISIWGTVFEGRLAKIDGP